MMIKKTNRLIIFLEWFGIVILARRQLRVIAIHNRMMIELIDQANWVNPFLLISVMQQPDQFY